MKILIEEIVKKNPANGFEKKGYRRQRWGSFDFAAPVDLLTEMIGMPLFFGATSEQRREVIVVGMRMAVFERDSSIGFIFDVVSREIFDWLEDDDDAPADYEAFLKLENIES